ncbi:hypothetical protein L873DRAFT_1700414 [Choiromyces venosus 120613-1]|uniref:Uncharacterized protein n=1 Tax=Choiromyces venosus 120613-1 TaxID=1336337 RepID=A0A3N4JDY0_9PEZI|nr:hypothetical protein L873DRAFT_1700414 [Choiromyces venosus 120613-1]
MLTFIAVRCLNCNNVDQFPRMDYDEIPYCSQCAATSGLVPATPPTKPDQTWEGGDELANLFSRNLSLRDNSPEELLLTPPGASPTGINFSVSQHYIQPTAFGKPAAEKPQEPASGSSTADQERSYIQYLLSSNLGSESSTNDLEIALAHGIIDNNMYNQALETHNQLLRQREQQEAEARMIQVQIMSEMQQGQSRQATMALEENCTAHSLLSATGRQKAQDPVFRTSDFFNDYYGGVDSSYLDDDEYAPCSVYGGQGSCHLRPFDL